MIILFPGCIYFEIAEFVAKISNTHRIEVLSPEGKPVRVSEGIEVVADHAYSEASLENCDFVVVPGGDIYAVANHQDLNHLLLQADKAQTILLGGICNGALVLGQSGILKGKRCTHVCTEKYAPVPEFQELLDFATPFFADSIYIDLDVVVDQQIVTAKPHAFREFADTLIKLQKDLSTELS